MERIAKILRLQTEPKTKAWPSREKIFWPLGLGYILFNVAGLCHLFSGTTFYYVDTYAPLALAMFHACVTLRARRGLAFIVLAAFVGFWAEFLGLRYGTVFGGTYTYKVGANLAGVPWVIIAYWAIFIYTGYWLVTSFLRWRGRAKPDYKTTELARVGLLVLCDGLVVTALDLFMDPIQVRASAWHWTHGGPYFGVPIGNFVGWFGVVVIACGIFRLLEYYRPVSAPQGIGNMTYVLPTLGYLLTAATFLLSALKYHMVLLGFIGTCITIVPAVANLALFLRFRNRAHILASQV